MTNPVVGVTVLVIVLAVGLLALFSAHIPILRQWTGAAPLEKEPEDAPEQGSNDSREPSGTG